MPNEYDPKPFDEPPPLPPDPQPYVHAELYQPATPPPGPPPAFPVSDFANSPVPPPLPPPIAAGPLQAPASNGMAIAAMVLGIASCVLFCFCWGIPSMICGVLAIVLAGQAERELALRGGSPREAAVQAKTGRICGIIGLCLAVVMLLLGIVFVAIGVMEEASKNP